MKEDKKVNNKTTNDVTLNPQDLIDPISKLVIFNYEDTPITEIVNAIIVDSIRLIVLRRRTHRGIVSTFLF